MVEEKPTAAFVLSLIGGILILINGIVALIMAAILGTAMALIGFEALAGIILAISAWAFICGIIVLVGAILLYGNPVRYKTTSGILIIVFSILSLGGGWVIGFILGLVGGILALVWKPKAAPVIPPPPPPPASPTPT
jgi:hypothetical protein